MRRFTTLRDALGRHDSRQPRAERNMLDISCPGFRPMLRGGIFDGDSAAARRRAQRANVFSGRWLYRDTTI